MKVKKLLTCFLTVALVIAICFVFAACGEKTPADQTPTPTPPSGGIEDEFYVTELSILTPPQKTSYLEGEEFDYAGMTLKAVWSDDEEETLHPLECEITPEGPLTADVTEITLTYEGKSVTQEITVISATATGLTINTDSVETAVVLGATLDLSTLTVSATFNGNASRDVTSECTFTLNDVEIADLSAVTINKEGDNIVKAKYEEIEAQFTVTAFYGKVIEAENILSSPDSSAKDYVSANTDIDNETDRLCRVVDVYSGQTASGDAYLGDVRKDLVLTFHVYADVAATSEIVLRTANGYLTQAVGWTPVVMTEVKFNEIFSVKINGELYEVPDSVVLPEQSAEDPIKGDDTLWTKWVDVTFGIVNLNQGDNIIELTVISQLLNCWYNSATANIDRLEIRYSQGDA